MRKFEADYLLERIKNIILDSQDVGNCIDNDRAFKEIDALFQSKIELDPFYWEDDEKRLYYEKFKRPLELNELNKIETAHQLTEYYNEFITYSEEKLHPMYLKLQERSTYYALIRRMDDLLLRTKKLLREE